MQIPLTPEHERLVRELVDGERYLTPGEVVRDALHDALHLLEDRERLRALRLEELRREFQKGFDSGPTVPFDPGRLKQRIREKLAEERSSWRAGRFDFAARRPGPLRDRLGQPEGGRAADRRPHGQIQHPG